MYRRCCKTLLLHDAIRAQPRLLTKGWCSLKGIYGGPAFRKIVGLFFFSLSLFEIRQIEKFFFIVHMNIFTQVYSAKACDSLSVLWCLYPWKCQNLIFRGGESATEPWFQSKHCSIDSVIEALFPYLPFSCMCLLLGISAHYVNREKADDRTDAEFTRICNLKSHFSYSTCINIHGMQPFSFNNVFILIN